MAGISFTLESMARGKSLSALAGAYGHAAMIVAGPWIFTMIGLAGTSFAACESGCMNVQIYRSIIIYNSTFALVLTSPLAFVCTRYIADRVYLKRFESVLFALVASLSLYCAVALAWASWFYGWEAALSFPERIAAVQNLILLGGSWLMIPFLGALRSAGDVTMAFVLGASAMVAIALLMPSGDPFFLLQAFNAGVALIVGVLLFLLIRQCGPEIAPDIAFWDVARKNWELPLIGLTYGLGLWIDKWIMWTMAPGEKMRVAGALVTMPAYDTPMFLAQLASLPVLAGFFIHAETSVLRLYRRLYGAIAGRENFREIDAAATALRRFTDSAIYFLLEKLGAIALLGVLASFLAVDAFGIQPNQIALLRTALFAMVFGANGMFCIIMLLYLDQRRAALVVTTAYLILNAALTWLLLPYGFRYFGFGAFLAAVAEFSIAFWFLHRETPWLLYHIFVTNNGSVDSGGKG
jgi:uncharacterized membrane protein